MSMVDNILIKEVCSQKAPSVEYVFFTKDSIIHKFQYGLADIKNRKQVDEHTTYHAYSVTKTFTALAILQLVEQGKLNIDESVKKYLLDFPYSTEITIRQLVSHSSGIPNPIPLSWIHLANEHESFNRKEFITQIISKNTKTNSKPNEKYAYSNLEYVLLGQLIETISGISYEQYISDNIIKKLQLQSNDMSFAIPEFNQHAKGYHKQCSFSNLILGILIDKTKYMGHKEGKWLPFKNIYVNGAAYGGLIGTPNAFVKYIQELLKPNCNLISDDYKKMMFTENYTNKGKATGMCLAWFIGELNGKKYFAHAGGGGGYYSEIRIYPQLGIGSVIMFNRTGMTDERFLDKVDKYYIK